MGDIRMKYLLTVQRTPAHLDQFGYIESGKPQIEHLWWTKCDPMEWLWGQSLATNQNIINARDADKSLDFDYLTLIHSERVDTIPDDELDIICQYSAPVNRLFTEF
jgi:hypothetical protein